MKDIIPLSCAIIVDRVHKFFYLNDHVHGSYQLFI